MPDDEPTPDVQPSLVAQPSPVALDFSNSVGARPVVVVPQPQARDPGDLAAGYARELNIHQILAEARRVIRIVRMEHLGEYRTLIDLVEWHALEHRDLCNAAERSYQRSLLHLRELDALPPDSLEVVVARDDARRVLGDAWLDWRRLHSTFCDLLTCLVHLRSNAVPKVSLPALTPPPETLRYS